LGHERPGGLGCAVTVKCAVEAEPFHDGPRSFGSCNGLMPRFSSNPEMFRAGNGPVKACRCLRIGAAVCRCETVCPDGVSYPPAMIDVWPQPISATGERAVEGRLLGTQPDRALPEVALPLLAGLTLWCRPMP
jgi:hypothetical protein